MSLITYIHLKVSVRLKSHTNQLINPLYPHSKNYIVLLWSLLMEQAAQGGGKSFDY